MNLPIRGGCVRTAASALLMVLATLLAFAAVAGSAVDRLAHTAGPAREIAGSLPQDDAVREALPPLVLHSILDQLPAGVPVPSALEDVLERASARAVTAVLDSSGFQPAWMASIDASREAYVDRLEAVRTGKAETAPVVLELGPLATQGVQRLKDGADGLGLGMLAGALPTDVEASVEFDVPGIGPEASARIATLVWAAGFWGWAAAVAALAAVAAILLARPRARGPVLVLGGLLTCAWAIILLNAPGQWVPADGGAPAPQSGQTPGALLGEAVRAHASSVVGGRLETAGILSLVAGGAVLVLGVVIRLIEDRRRNG